MEVALTESPAAGLGEFFFALSAFLPAGIIFLVLNRQFSSRNSFEFLLVRKAGYWPRMNAFMGTLAFTLQLVLEGHYTWGLVAFLGLAWSVWWIVPWFNAAKAEWEASQGSADA